MSDQGQGPVGSPLILDPKEWELPVIPVTFPFFWKNETVLSIRRMPKLAAYLWEQWNASNQDDGAEPLFLMAWIKSRDEFKFESSGLLCRMQHPINYSENNAGEPQFRFAVKAFESVHIRKWRKLDNNSVYVATFAPNLADDRMDLTDVTADHTQEYLDYANDIMGYAYSLLSVVDVEEGDTDQVFGVLSLLAQAINTRSFTEIEYVLYGQNTSTVAGIDSFYGIFHLLYASLDGYKHRLDKFHRQNLEELDPTERLASFHGVLRRIWKEEKKGDRVDDAKPDFDPSKALSAGSMPTKVEDLDITSAEKLSTERINVRVYQRVKDYIPEDLRPVQVHEPMANGYVELDSEAQSPLTVGVHEFMLQNVVGQERFARRFMRAWQVVQSGMKSENSPAYKAFCSGPSGVGKSEFWKVLALLMFGSKSALTKFDGNNYVDRHYVSQLLGSPPSFIGYGEEPRLSQWSLDQYDYFARYEDDEEFNNLWAMIRAAEAQMKQLEAQNMERSKQYQRLDAQISEYLKALGDKQYNPDDDYWSIILVDELEKAHEAFIKLWLGVLEDGELALNKPGEVTRFGNTLLGFTSNVGSQEISDVMKGRGSLGFHIAVDEDVAVRRVDRNIYQVTMEAIDREEKIPPELIGRMDDILIARPLTRSAFELIFELRLRDFMDEMAAKDFDIALEMDPAFKEFVVDESSDKPELGARPLKGNIRKYLYSPLSGLKNTGQIASGDTIRVALKNHDEMLRDKSIKPEFLFLRKHKNA